MQKLLLQGQNMCGSNHASGIVIPFVPNFMEEGKAEFSQGRKVIPYEKRTSLLHFHGRCIHNARMNPSRLLRSYVVEGIQDQGDDIHVSYSLCFCSADSPVGFSNIQVSI